MGDRGAPYFAFRLPSRFAAVLSVSPISPITAWGRSLAQMPVWLFHGTVDASAPIAETKELVQAIEAAGGHPRFNSLEGRDHLYWMCMASPTSTTGFYSRSEEARLPRSQPGFNLPCRTSRVTVREQFC